MNLLLRYIVVVAVFCGVSLALATEQVGADTPERVVAPKRATIQLCAPTLDSGTGFHPGNSVSGALAFGVKTCVSTAVAGAKYAALELSTAPRQVRQTVHHAGDVARNAYDETASVAESAIAVIQSLTASFLSIVSSSFSALVSVIWPS
jgi:hypothetical protein